MPTISSTTTLTLAAGQAYVFLAGSGVGIAVADPGGRSAKYSIGPQQTAIGPFSTSVSVDVLITSGSIEYRVDTDGDLRDQDPAIAAQAAAIAAVDERSGFSNSSIVLGLLGDSLMNRTHTTTTLSSAPSYNPATGLAIFTQTSHGHFTGMLCRIGNADGDMYEGLSLTRVDANTFTVQFPVGLTLPVGSSWSISMASSLHAEGPYTHLRPSRPALRVYAASGSLSSEILEKQLPRALSGDANVIWLRAGTNNVPSGVSNVDSTFADIRDMADAVVNSGRKLILSTLPPYIASTYGGVFVSNLNSKIRQYAQSLSNCFLIDEYSLCVDPTSTTGAERTAYLYDHAHMSPVFAAQVGEKLQSILDSINPSRYSLCPSSALDGYDASINPNSTQPLSNPTLATASGGTNGSSPAITGTIASGLTCYSTGGFTSGAVVASVVPSPWGKGNAQQLVASPTAASDTLRITTRASESSTASRMTAGERRRGVAHLRISGLSGQSVLREFYALVVITTGEGTFGTRISDRNWGAYTASHISQSDIDIDIETGDFVIPSGMTSIYLDIRCIFAASGTAVTMQAGQFGFPLVG